KVVAALERLAVDGEVASLRERCTDNDGGLVPAAVVGGSAAAAAGGKRHRRAGGDGREGQEPGTVRSHPVLLPVLQMAGVESPAAIGAPCGPLMRAASRVSGRPRTVVPGHRTAFALFVSAGSSPSEISAFSLTRVRPADAAATLSKAAKSWSAYPAPIRL